MILLARELCAFGVSLQGGIRVEESTCPAYLMSSSCVDASWSSMDMDSTAAHKPTAGSWVEHDREGRWLV